MSTSLLVRAKEKIERLNAKERGKRLLQKQELAVALGGATQLSTAPQAAFIDIKLGKNGEQAKLIKIPVNIMIGGPIALASFFAVKYPVLAAILAGEGFGLVNNGLYRLILDVHAKHVAEQQAQGGAPPP